MFEGLVLSSYITKLLLPTTHFHVVQVDLPDLMDKVGRLCQCQVGPAGAVSGYLAFGTSMDYMYVHGKVPYPLTVEVYGGGEEGRLKPGGWLSHSSAAVVPFCAKYQPCGLRQRWLTCRIKSCNGRAQAPFPGCIVHTMTV